MPNYLHTGPSGLQSQTWSQASQPPASAGSGIFQDPYNPLFKDPDDVLKKVPMATLGFGAEPWDTIHNMSSVVGMAAGAYHGYKRNDSVGWAVGWALLGGLFPIIAIPVAFAQGFGKPAKK